MTQIHAPIGAHVFEGAPDGRQSDDPDMPVSRFRPRYRALSDDEKALHDAIKAKASEMEALFAQVPQSVTPAKIYGDAAIQNLELAVMWAVKALTS